MLENQVELDVNHYSHVILLILLKMVGRGHSIQRRKIENDSIKITWSQNDVMTQEKIALVKALTASLECYAELFTITTMWMSWHAILSKGFVFVNLCQLSCVYFTMSHAEWLLNEFIKKINALMLN